MPRSTPTLWFDTESMKKIDVAALEEAADAVA